MFKLQTTTQKITFYNLEFVILDLFATCFLWFYYEDSHRY